ncbi:MAG: 16S rRNA (cytosine(1402)-N(4))-methyltransferase RsmH [Deltaproteobacteria bacterium]|nr:16S rRNA (cytosine(1402)-N(4))-methyltransferase RsmH [Deltaproteobacteria bacterium]MBW1845844.1 16S rRNA (cytosine(1402)-N(4))-methyltransferase RsmH [Deltaproteobacteria bacterium]MBW1983981.1 16S rRNA (cytosine(1402)-N(4))-methyltransferase RsmH [Deltaproteobacteria bacterium]MBW2363915.1 16S rRNA (cytosine(1402)-N(4))-methyltransferase RsmH [Deltaproteobacteria bacterium]
MPYKHIPAMSEEVIHYLNCMPGNICVDCTLGGSGHASAICKKIMPDGLLIGIDQDIDAIQNAKKILKPFELNIHLFHSNFIHLPDLLNQLNIPAVNGILLDLGLSLHHLESSGRGFSFKKDEPLDMRMDITSEITAEDIINTFEEKKLAKLFKRYGEERYASQIAKKIVRTRQHQPILTSSQLADIISGAIPKRMAFTQKIHPATRVFMALRIAVNKELEKLGTFIETAPLLLAPKGRICVISYHSLEDRIVKHWIKNLEADCVCPKEFPTCVCDKKKVVRSLTKKTIRPTEKEIENNPNARSAKLRAAEKI